jgi:hypothetical protein
MIDLFPKANVILSTQPLPFNFEEMFGRVYPARGTVNEESALTQLKTQLSELDASSLGQRCGLDKWNDARQWFMPASALRLEAMVEQYERAGRNVQYLNPGVLFPNLMSDRKEFFIDPVHLNDAGMDQVARLYAETILATDIRNQFEKPHWAGQPLPDFAPGEPLLPDQIRISDATYGMNCRDFKVPAPGVNRVRPGNATETVAAACERKKGICQYTIDVTKIGDPAGTCGKDFSVSWRCGLEVKRRVSYVEAEANGKIVSISCLSE